MAGGARISAPSLSLVALLGLLLAAGPAAAQSLYKYQGADGEWIYADRPPDDDSLVEVRVLEDGGAADVGIDVTYEFRGRTVELVAANPSYVPIELTLEFRTIRGVEFPDPDDDLRWVVPPRSDTLLMALDLLEKTRNRTRSQVTREFRSSHSTPNSPGSYLSDPTSPAAVQDRSVTLCSFVFLFLYYLCNLVSCLTLTGLPV
mgnify:CR=1 FL=1